MRISSSLSPTASCLLALLWLVSTPAGALTYVAVPDENLADRADLIVEVQVLEVDESPGIGRPVTDFSVAVERVIRGDVAASPLTVRVSGGLLPGGMGLHLHGAPSFLPEQRVLLFLKSQPDGTFSVLHFALGAFHLVEHGGAVLALRNLAEAKELQLPGRPAPQDGPRDLERFRSWLVDRARGVERAADYFVDALDPAIGRQKFTLLTHEGRKIRWRFDVNGSEAIRVHQGGQPGLDGDGFSQTQAAAAAWRGESGSDVRYNYGGATSASGGLTNFDGTSAILFDDPNDNSSFEEPFNCTDGGVIAVGGPWFSGTHVHNGETFWTAINGDAVTNKGIDCVPPGQTEPWINRNRRAEEVFAHELGHTLGLGHSCGDDDSPSCSSSGTLDNALMRAQVHGDGRGATLNNDDKAGIRFLYGDVEPPPAAPSNLSASAVSANRIDLSWNDNSDNETSFEIERRMSGGSFEEIDDVGMNTTSYQDTSVLSGTSYTYRVRARNSAGASGYSNEDDATTPGEVPPSDLSAFGASDTEIQLFWTDNSSGEDGFQIERRTGGGPFSVVQEVAANETEATIEDLAPVTTYTFRVRAVGGAGDSGYSNEATSTTFFSDPDPCVPGTNTLCLNDGRFKVEVTWTDFMNQMGPGIDAGLTAADSGLFYFFSPNNWEMLVKVIDGCATETRHFWVFAAATTNVAYDLVVTDSVSGFSRTYSNELGVSSPAVIDTSAFATCFATVPATPSAPPSTGPAAGEPALKGGCLPSDTRFCFNGGRYAVELEWQNFSGGSGFARKDPLQTGDSGLFYFVDPENLEMLVKVLDGCAINDRVWVFAAATTNFEYTLRVTDTVTDVAREYDNELGNLADAITDAGAFDSCP